MATKSRSSKSRASKNSTRSSTKRGRPPAKKAPARSSAAKKRSAKKPAPSPVRHTLAAALEGRGAELTGLFLIVAGIIAALGIYTETAGPLGEAFDDGFGWVMGVFRYLAPPAIVLAGLAVIRRGDEPYDLSPRMLVGGFAALVATAGLVHLAGDSPAWQAAHGGPPARNATLAHAPAQAEPAGPAIGAA